MATDLKEVVPLLARDVESTVGGGHERVIQDVAADVQELDIGNKAEKVVNDVQQYLHDTLGDATWPACPRHAKHPLWYRRGAWWCVEDGVAVAKLGELGRSPGR